MGENKQQKSKQLETDTLKGVLRDLVQLIGECNRLSLYADNDFSALHKPVIKALIEAEEQEAGRLQGKKPKDCEKNKKVRENIYYSKDTTVRLLPQGLAAHDDLKRSVSLWPGSGQKHLRGEVDIYHQTAENLWWLGAELIARHVSRTDSKREEDVKRQLTMEFMDGSKQQMSNEIWQAIYHGGFPLDAKQWQQDTGLNRGKLRALKERYEDFRGDLLNATHASEIPPATYMTASEDVPEQASTILSVTHALVKPSVKAVRLIKAISDALGCELVKPPFAAEVLGERTRKHQRDGKE